MKPQKKLSPLRPLVLKRIALARTKDRRELVQFVNTNYPSKIRLTETDLQKSDVVYFWAFDAETHARIGCTAYLIKTRFLVETIKTIIDQDYRGQGYGEALSQAIEDEVRRRGFKKILTTIYIDNLPMIFIKLKQGYRFEGFHPNHEKPGLHEYSFGKELGKRVD